jgi:hypothetical protein
MDIETINLPPPILKYTTTSNKQIIFKINNKINEDFYSNDLIHKLKNIHLTNDIKHQKIKIIGENEFKNIN